MSAPLGFSEATPPIQLSAAYGRGGVRAAVDV